MSIHSYYLCVACLRAYTVGTFSTFALCSVKFVSWKRLHVPIHLYIPFLLLCWYICIPNASAAAPRRSVRLTHRTWTAKSAMSSNVEDCHRLGPVHFSLLTPHVYHVFGQESWHLVPHLIRIEPLCLTFKSSFLRYMAWVWDSVPRQTLPSWNNQRGATPTCTSIVCIWH